MKIVVAAEGPTLKSPVASKLGEARFFVFKSRQPGEVEAHKNPARGAGQGAVVKSLEELARLKPQVLVTGFCPPWVEKSLTQLDIKVVNGFRGTVEEALTGAGRGPVQDAPEQKEVTWAGALAMTGRQLSGMLPVFVGIVLLMGMLREIVTPQALEFLFKGPPLTDGIWGAVAGSVVTGQPLNSYVIADQMLRQNVSLVGVTALMATWVNVGVVQLPLEIKAMGLKFALLRNSLGFFLSLAIAWCMGALHLAWPWSM